MTDLSGFLGNVHSQNGEDGLLAEIFARLEISTGYFVEFGAWDGKHLSNCFALVEGGWRGCYIEGNPERYNDLVKNIPQDNVAKVSRFVAAEGKNSLDSILDEVGAPDAPDLLSIDIDGDDLAVWRGLTRRRPRCVVIEYNPTIPFDLSYENPPGASWGNSAKALVALGSDMDYTLVAATFSNLIFLDSRHALSSSGLTPVALSDVSPGERYFWGFDGTMLISRPWKGAGHDVAPEVFRVPWVKTLMTQPVPRRLRGYTDELSTKTRLRAALSISHAAATRPVALARLARERFTDARSGEKPTNRECE